MMSPETFRDRFGFPVFVVCLISIVVGGILWLVSSGIYANHRGLNHFQHDFFSTLSGNTSEMKYDRSDAREIALALRAIPKDRLEEDFADMQTLFEARSRDSVKNQLVIKDSSKFERVPLYADFFSNENFRDTFREMTPDILGVLRGNPPLQIEEVGDSFYQSGSFWLTWILATQFIAFAAYSMSCLLAEWWNLGRSKNYNPLLDLPSGLGSKLALLITVPGSLPLILLILLFSGGRVIASRKVSRSYRSDGGHIELSSESTQASLAALKERAGRVQ